MTKEEKINFFLKCQTLLQEYHKDSSFLFTVQNMSERQQYVREIASNYKGFCYADDNVCVLFNKIKINDPSNPVEALKFSKYKAPIEDYNAVSIDFVVFKDLKDCLPFCKENYTAQIKYVLYVKNHQPKIFETTKLMSNVLGIPIVG